jgi:hypothetical protein
MAVAAIVKRLFTEEESEYIFEFLKEKTFEYIIDLTRGIIK